MRVQLKPESVSSLTEICNLPEVEVFTKFSDDRKHRYLMEILMKDEGTRIVCAVMQNPSYACKEIADKSINFLEQLIFTKGRPEFKNVGKLVIVNQFSYIQTTKFKGGTDKLDEKTNFYIHIGISQADIILLAWGPNNKYKDRSDDIKSYIDFTKQEVYFTKTHPSHGKYDELITEQMP
jgi:hypothetical protein